MASSSEKFSSLDQALSQSSTEMEIEGRKLAAMTEAERESELESLREEAKSNPSARAWLRALALHLSAFHKIKIDV